jgi:hypothetical protein
MCHISESSKLRNFSGKCDVTLLAGAFLCPSFVQDTNDHDILIVHDHVEYDVVPDSDSQESVSYLVIGAIGDDGWVQKQVAG